MAKRGFAGHTTLIPPSSSKRNEKSSYVLMKKKPGQDWKWVANGFEDRIFDLFQTMNLKVGVELEVWRAGRPVLRRVGFQTS